MLRKWPTLETQRKSNEDALPARVPSGEASYRSPGLLVGHHDWLRRVEMH